MELSVHVFRLLNDCLCTDHYVNIKVDVMAPNVTSVMYTLVDPALDVQFDPWTDIFHELPRRTA